jgi:hypothetical protein
VELITAGLQRHYESVEKNEDRYNYVCNGGQDLTRRWAQSSTGLSHRNALRGISQFPN